MNKFIYIFLLILFTQQLANCQDSTTLTHEIGAEESAKMSVYRQSRDFTATNPPNGTVRNIAEFEPMESVLVRYPFGVPVSFIAEMSEDIVVTTICANINEENSIRSTYTSSGVNLDNCVFLHAPSDSYWVRDYGPWWITDGADDFGIVNFPYDRPRPNDNDIPIAVSNDLNVNLFGMDLEHTGGNYMCDGMGVAASTDLVWEENSSMTHDEINEVMNDFLGIHTYHVLIDPPGDYIKHIDCWGKFLDVDKVIIGQVPVSDSRYGDYEFVANYFAQAISSYGVPYQVFRVYSPGGYPATPYTNSLILNDKVFVPQSGSQWDDEAIAVYEEAMPGYEIIGIMSDNWEDTDALHCRSKGLADKGMLHIYHLPILGEIDNQNDYEITATIKAYSGESLYADSLKVYYKVDNSDYQFVALTTSGNDLYSVTIPMQDAGSEISYFIHAADESMRSENHPLIGISDPHVFSIKQPTAPILSVSEAEVELTMAADETETTTIQLSNIGTGTLDFSIAFTDFSLSNFVNANPLSGNIVAGNSTEIILSFDATGLTDGEYTANMVVTDNSKGTVNIPITLTINGTSAISSPTEVLQKIRSYPNPFSDEVTVSFDVMESINATFEVFSLTGKLLYTANEDCSAASTQKFVWNSGSNNSVPTGIYVYRITTQKSAVFGKIIKLK